MRTQNGGECSVRLLGVVECAVEHGVGPEPSLCPDQPGGIGPRPCGAAGAVAPAALKQR